MKSLRELERELEALESAASKHALHLTLEDGRNIKLHFRDYDDTIRLMSYAIRNEEHPYKKYVLQAVKGRPEEGQFVMTCKALWSSHSMKKEAF